VTIIGWCELHDFTLRDGDGSPTMAGKQAELPHREAPTRKPVWFESCREHWFHCRSEAVLSL
jgi:hypothetical protein